MKEQPASRRSYPWTHDRVVEQWEIAVSLRHSTVVDALVARGLCIIKVEILNQHEIEHKNTLNEVK